MPADIETAKEFWVEFNKKLEGLKNDLDALEANKDPKANVAKSFAVLKATLVALQVFATDSTDILPAYDIRRTQEEIDSLGKKIRQKEEVLLPRKKFRFSREKLASKGFSTSAGNDAEEKTTSLHENSMISVPSQAESNNNNLEGSVLVIDKHNETILLSDRDFAREDCNGQLLVQRCRGCSVHVTGVAGSVRLEGLDDCTILLGPSRTSVYIEGCTNSVFYVACHQLRIHKTTGSRVYTRCRTHPIIEDCSTLGFGPYSLSYPQWESHFAQANLADASSWDNVVDFRWHRTTHSPNWYVIAEERREALVLTSGGVLVTGTPAGTSIFNNITLNESVGEACDVGISTEEKQLVSVEDDEDEL